MNFISISFIVFIAVLFLFYYILPLKYRHVSLIIANLVFYGSYSLKFLAFLLIFSGITYGFGVLMKQCQTNRKENIVLSLYFLSITVAIILLAGIGMIQSSYVVSRLSQLSAGMKLFMPLGFSYYTLKSISYILDIKRKQINPEKNFLFLLLYLTFFADIVSGPINRAKEMLPQFRNLDAFSYERSVLGLRQILLGLVKKIIIADTIAKYTGPVFGNLSDFQGGTLLIAVVLYSFELYFDFSGYSDLVIGIAKVFGIQCRNNFNTPYCAASPQEFWGRWHISLSTWLKDYVYISLGGNRQGKMRTYLNILLTFMVSGLWHGLSVNFLIWGCLHGLYQIIHREWVEVSTKLHWRERVPKRISMFIAVGSTYCAVTFAWIFFKTTDLSQAFYVIKNLLKGFSIQWIIRDYAFSGFDLSVIGFFLPVMLVLEYICKDRTIIEEFAKMNIVLRWGVSLLLGFAICVVGLHGGGNQSFIYFQF